MQWYYIENVNSSSCTLSAEESKHIIRVLRLRKGDHIYVTDGKGNLYDAVIENALPKGTELRIISNYSEYGKRKFHLHIAIAPTKNMDRFEWFLEKSTEIGIDEITPLITDHSEREAVKTERLEKIIISALKQSQKTFKPKLNPIQRLSNLLVLNSSGTSRFIAHCGEVERPLLKNVYVHGSDSIVLIGPEGDFSAEEVSAAINHGFKPVSLGESRLRTETAGIVACLTINLINEG